MYSNEFYERSTSNILLINNNHMCWDNAKARSKYQQTEKTETKNDQIKEKIPGYHRSEESVTITLGPKLLF